MESDFAKMQAKRHRESAAYHDRMAAAARRDNDQSDVLEHERQAREYRRAARKYEVE